LILLPWAIPPVVNGLMWQWIYDSKIGALNGLLVSLGIISEYRGWLSDPTIGAAGAGVCRCVERAALAVILLLAALQKIPASL
jgi:multiple sugar transport system permease protein